MDSFIEFTYKWHNSVNTDILETITYVINTYVIFTQKKRLEKAVLKQEIYNLLPLPPIKEMCLKARWHSDYKKCRNLLFWKYVLQVM